jgi:NADH-quinone oxidoreductase subunit C
MSDTGHTGDSANTPSGTAHSGAAKPVVSMASAPWQGELPEQLAGNFGARILKLESYLGQNFVVASLDAVPGVLEFLKLEADFDFLTDFTAVDYPERPERFELVYVLYSFVRNEYLRVKAQAAEGQTAPTATGVYPAANWLEREIFDMFGIRFDGHPDLKRILLPDEWQGHPLRRDHSIIGMDNQWVKQNLDIESGQ